MYYTVEDYQHWEGDWELIYGCPYAMAPSPLVTHQNINIKIVRQLDEQLDNCPKCQPLFEIASDSTVKRDETLKFELYQNEGVSYYVIVYPKTNIAKLYKLRDGRYIKENDFSDEMYASDLDGCQIEFDFSKIWRVRG